MSSSRACFRTTIAAAGLLAAALQTSPTAAEPPITLAERAEGSGVGLIIGEPTGLSAAWRRDGPSTFDAALAWSVPEERFHLHLDYLYEVVSFRDPAAPVVEFPVYIGIGPRLHLGGGNRTKASIIGLRVPVGLNIAATDFPVEGFFELVPVLGLYPETRMDFDAALGVRVFFVSRFERVKRGDAPASSWDQIESEEDPAPTTP
jgi:hypothetical protein